MSCPQLLFSILLPMTQLNGLDPISTESRSSINQHNGPCLRFPISDFSPAPLSSGSCLLTPRFSSDSQGYCVATSALRRGGVEDRYSLPGSHLSLNLMSALDSERVVACAPQQPVPYMQIVHFIFLSASLVMELPEVQGQGIREGLTILANTMQVVFHVFSPAKHSPEVFIS